MGELARLWRSLQVGSSPAFGVLGMGSSPLAREWGSRLRLESGRENRELAAECRKVALGESTMMRREGIFLGGVGCA